jgi:cytochrome c oxidase subunit II
MRSQLPLALLLMAATLALTSSTVPGPSNTSSNASEGVKVIDVTAKKYEFDPSPIRVKQGTRVQLKITATDHTHGFRLTEYPEGVDTKPGLVFTSAPECWKIEKGQTATVEFVAQTPGTYSFKCCVHCGWRHREMKGKLIVEP